MLAALVRFLIRLLPILSYDYRHRIRAKQQCPACGSYRRHAMKFNPLDKIVELQCAQCEARWGYNPRVTAQTWAKPITEE